MTDIPAAALAVVDPAANATPPVPLTRETATARLEAIKSDPAWVSAFTKGDIKATSEHAELWRAIYNEADQQTQATAQAREERVRLVEQLKTVADIPPAVAKQVIDDTPVSAAERRMVEQEWERLKSDATWLKAWLSGDRNARRDKALIDIIMARPVIKE